MTDIAFIVDTSDAALPSGRAVTPVSPDSKGAGSFSGMLGERLQSNLAKPPKEGNAPPQVAVKDTNTVVESGATEPLDGNPLPVSPSDPSLPLLPEQSELPLLEQATSVLADAALAVAMNQSAPQAVTAPVTVTIPKVAAVADAPTTEKISAVDASQLSNLASNVSNALDARPILAAHVTPQVIPQVGAGVPDAQLAVTNIEKQLTPVLPNGMSAAKQDAQSNNSQTNTASLSPALLAQPVSESAQRALALAMKDAGLGKRGISSIAGQSETALANTARPAGLSALSNGLTANGLTNATQLANAAANTVSINNHEAMTRIALQQGASTALVAPTTITGATGDVSGVLPVGQSVSNPVSSAFMPTMSVSTPVGQTGWANELGQRVSWLAQGELREAQLQLHPRSLGPVEVRIAIGTDQQLNVSFTAANPVAREALDAALPRLREMFEQQGLNLADANISQHSFSEQQHQENEEGDSDTHSGQWSAETESLIEEGVLSNSQLMGAGMLDAYA